MNFPLSILTSVNAANPWTYVVFALIGFAFGFTLEMSGFGDSRKLAAQFYFTELTVLKVMFTAIVTAMVLTFGAVGLGILDFSQVWVNPTYIWSGIFGGLIMGVGFIIGGFCPTTSLASASTGKIDGMLFMLGGFFGAAIFAETEPLFTNWYNNAGYFGRLTLDQVFGHPRRRGGRAGHPHGALHVLGRGATGTHLRQEGFEQGTENPRGRRRSLVCRSRRRDVDRLALGGTKIRQGQVHPHRDHPAIER